MNVPFIIVFSVWSCFGFYIGNVLVVSPREHMGTILLNLLFSPMIPLVGLILYFDSFLTEWCFTRPSLVKEDMDNNHNVKTETMERDEEQGLLS